MTNKEFIETIGPAARLDMATTGILASITTAQACLESAYGTSELAVYANNLFGMKAMISGNTWSSEWDGSTYIKDTKEQDANGNESTETATFRKYTSWAQSIKDHSDYLSGAMNGNALRYAGLAGCMDYRTAAQIIKDGGYATDTAYVDKLCAVIENNNLTQYDKGGNTMKICLDAGHYGKYNQSPANSAYYESDMVWKLHLMLKSYLEAYGVEVITTRANQATDLALYSRGTASAGCDLFISLHSNAVVSGVDDSVDYPASFCAVNGSADDIGLLLARVVEKIIPTEQTARIEKKKSSNGDYDYYGVLRGATAVGAPGLILEHSFHTNTRIAAWLLDDNNLDALAKAEADCIASFYGLSAEKKSGWVEENGGWRFYLGDTGDYVTNDWYQDGDKWYWFDGAGMMVADVWYFYNDSWYYLGSDGAMVKGLLEDNGKWYFTDENGELVTEPITLTPDDNGALQYPGLAEQA